MFATAQSASTIPEKSTSIGGRTTAMVAAVIIVVTTVLSGCATAADKSDKYDRPKHPPAMVPEFSLETAKALSFSKERVVLMFVIDEAGKVQTFRAPGTKAFTVKDLARHPLKADAIASFESFSIIKTVNPKFCWPTSDGGLKCVEY